MISAPSWAITQLQASVDQNPVIMGQSFELQLVADDIVNDSLDLSPLEQDFSVYRSDVSQNTQIINFDMKRLTQWRVVLLPKRLGQVTLPALNIDGVSSNPITMTVVAAKNSNAPQAQPVRIEVSLDEEEIWLGQATTATVRLILAADLQRGNLNAPEHPDVQIRQQGQDQNNTEIVDGRRLQVITRQYVLIPQRSGTIELGSINFSGDLMLLNSRNNFFNSGRTKAFSTNSDPITLNVKGQPASYQGQWLVADLVTLSADPLSQEQFEVGQPITLTLRLAAAGTVAEALPEISIPATTGLRAYPDKPEREGGSQNGQLLARLNQTIALVPQQPGDYTVPEIKVPWWNAKTNQQQWATLAAQTITVLPSSTAAPTVVAPALPSPTVTAPAPRLWLWLWQGLTALFALLWLLTAWWGWRRGQGHSAATPAAASHARPIKSLPTLLQACRANQGATVLNLLPRWGSEHLGYSVTLVELGQQRPTLAAHIQQLQHSCYSPQPEQWQGQALAQAIEQCQQDSVNTPPEGLPALNPASH